MANSTPIPEWLTADYMQSILRKSFDKSDLCVKKINIKPASAGGLNYLSQLLRITAFFEENGRTQEKTVIAKIKLSTAISESIPDDVFQVEADFFQIVLPKILANLTENFAPQCYHLDNTQNVMFLQDLSLSDYKQMPPHTFLTKNECRLAVEAIATMHGGSYQALLENPELKVKFPKSMINEEPSDIFIKMFINAEKVLLEHLPIYNLSDELCKKLMSFSDRYKEENGKVCQLAEGHLNFLVHGDASKNNMLFHYKDGIADSVKLLDFQTVTYNSFANDLQYFIFTSAQADVITQDLDYLLEAYFNQLKAVAPEIPNLTLDRVRNEFAERYYLGYLMTVVFRAMILNDGAVDFDAIMADKIQEVGFRHPTYVSELPRFMEFFTKVGVL